MKDNEKILLRKRLLKLTRKSLNSYLVDCHSFSKSEVAEWDDKEDLVSDIIRLGWGENCLESLGEVTRIKKVTRCEELGMIAVESEVLEKK